MIKQPETEETRERKIHKPAKVTAHNKRKAVKRQLHQIDMEHLEDLDDALDDLLDEV